MDSIVTVEEKERIMEFGLLSGREMEGVGWADETGSWFRPEQE